MIELYFLVVKLGYADVVLPEKYSKDQCYQIRKNDDLCIPAPTSNCYTYQYGGSAIITVPCINPIGSYK